MYVKKSESKKLYNRADYQLAEAGVKRLIPNEVLSDFRTTVSGIAKTRQYNEGDSIHPEDLIALQQATLNVIWRTSQQMQTYWKANLQPEERRKIESLPLLMLLNDDLFAYAMDALGCPDIPSNFGTLVELTIASSAKKTDFNGKEDDYKAADANECFKRQRKMDADVMRKGLESLETSLKEKNPATLDVAKYLGEYQALKRRQENHGRIWRYFHKNENIERTKLLEHMKTTLKGVLGSNTEIDTLTVERAAKKCIEERVDKEKAEAYKPDALGKRQADFDKNAFNYSWDEVEILGDKQSLGSKLEASLSDNKDKEISNKIHEEPKLRAPEIRAMQ